MKKKSTSPLTKGVATLIAASLIVAAPGLSAYDAIAAVLKAPAAVGTPGTGVGAVGGVTGVSAGNFNGITLSGAGNASLSPVLPSVSLQAAPGAETGVRINAAASPIIPGSRGAAIESRTAPKSAPAVGIPATAGVGLSGVPGRTNRGDKRAAPEESGKAASPAVRTRLSGIAQDSVNISAGVSDLSHDRLKTDADFTAAARKRAGAAPVSAKGGVFASLKSRLGRRTAAAKAEKSEPEVPKTTKESEEESHLLYDIHDGYFKAGYVAASVYQAGTALELPAGKGRSKAKERTKFIQGLAYRVAELHKSKAAGQRFRKRTEKASDDKVNELLTAAMAGMDTDHPVLRENLGDADFVQGYLTGMSWRPGKQLMMPAPSLGDRFKLGLRKKMRARDQRFMEGLYASLEGKEGAPAAKIREMLEKGPKVGTRDFGTRLGYVISHVMEPLYDKSIEEGLPYLPGKITIPRSLKGLVIGHTIFIMFGIYMHISAQPYLVYGLTGSKTMMGVVRNVHFGAYSASSFLPIGPTIDKTDFKTMFIWTSVARAALMGLIPILFFSGYMTFGVLLAIVALNPMFQSLMTNSDTASRDSFLGRDENVVREGTAFGAKVSAVSGLAIPAAAAWVVSQLVVAFGNPGGYAAAYAGYGLMLLLSIPIFMLMVRDPRYHDPSVKTTPSKNPLNIFMPLWTVLKIPYVAGRWLVGKIRTKLGKKNKGPSAEHEEALAAAKAREVPFQKGRPVRNFRERVARFFDKIEATQGVSVILRSDTLSLLVAISAIELFIADALMFVVIPNYIIDVIRPMASLGSVPIIGSMLTTPVGIMGLMLTAGAIGRYLGSRWASGPKGAQRIKKWGHGALYRAAGISGLTFWAMLIPTFFVAPAGAAGAAAMSIPLFAGSMGVLLLFQFALSMLATPLGISMAPVRRKQIPNDMVGKVSAAFTMVNVGLMALGALVIGILIDIVSIQTAIAIIATGITMTSILEWFAPGWLRKINPEGWENGERYNKAHKKKAADTPKAPADK